MSSIPSWANSSVASSLVNARSADLISVKAPVTRTRWSRSAGSARVSITRRSVQRSLLDQGTERIQHLRVGQLVHVVQHQHDRSGQLGKAGPDLQHLRGPEGRGRHQLPQRAVLRDDRADGECGEHIGPECP